MSESLREFGTLFVVVCINFVLGVGLGVSMADPGHHLDLTIAVAAGGIVCLTIAALIEAVVIAGRPR